MSLRSLVYVLICCSLYQSAFGKEGIRYNLVQGMPDIYITPNTERVGHTWSHGTVWDKPLIERFCTLLKKHDDFFVFFDLGAQTGSFSLLAKYFPHSRWYSFEPIQEAATALKENLALNNIHNVSVHQTAVSDFSGTITLQMPAMNEWGLATVGSNVLRFNPVATREVSCIDLDSFVKSHNIKQVHFMKLDTEGSELYILRGAKKMIMRDRPVVLMEYNETNMRQCGVSKQDVHEFLQEMGYEWELISSEDILCMPIV